MENIEKQSYTAFIGHKLLAHGPLEKVVLKVKHQSEENPTATVLVFSDSTGKQMDFDLSGTEKDILKRLNVYIDTNEPVSQSGPGRPKLGVVSREISLLPRHWEWLSNQPGGASVTLRRLVDETRKQSTGKEQIKKAQERTYTFLSSIAGNLSNYEEALRALFAKNAKGFEANISEWPKDIKSHARKLAAPALE
jgi:uncharacterized protein